jgi:iron complex transport system permease protein
VVPHIARILTGPDNKKLFVVSFLTGAAFLLIIDNISRTLLYFEIPVSILTGAIGAPVFIILLLKGGNGGWR